MLSSIARASEFEDRLLEALERTRKYTVRNIGISCLSLFCCLESNAATASSN